MYRIRLEQNLGTDATEHDSVPPVPTKRTKTGKGDKKTDTGSRSKSNKGGNEVVFIAFSSGRCVITGGKTRWQILHVWRQFFNTVLVRYRVQPDTNIQEESSLPNFTTPQAQEDWRTQLLVHSISSILPSIVAKAVDGNIDEETLDIDPTTVDFGDLMRRAHAFADVCALQGGNLQTYAEPTVVDLMHRLDRLRALPFDELVAPELQVASKLYKFVLDTRFELEPTGKDTPCAFRPIVYE